MRSPRRSPRLFRFRRTRREPPPRAFLRRLCLPCQPCRIRPSTSCSAVGSAQPGTRCPRHSSRRRAPRPFGPHGNGGVVVVNEAAHSLLDDLASPPACPTWWRRATRRPADAVLTRLFGADLVHPCGVEPAPRFRRSRELTVWMHVTNACNLACPYCYVNKSREAMDEATATETVDALVHRRRARLTAIRFKYAGGEAASTLPCCSRCTTTPGPLRGGGPDAVRGAAQQRGRDLRPARARTRRPGDRRHGVPGRHRGGPRRPAPTLNGRPPSPWCNGR